MPSYAYTCTECGHAFDIHQSFSDDALTECPQCDGPLRKVFGRVGVVFKGSGFYRTDSRSGNGTKTATVGAGSGSAGKSTSDSSASSTGSAAAGSSSGSSSSSATSSTGSIAAKPAAG